MLNLSTSMIEHLMQLFNLKPNVNSNLNDCMKNNNQTNFII